MSISAAHLTAIEDSINRLAAVTRVLMACDLEESRELLLNAA